MGSSAAGAAHDAPPRTAALAHHPPRAPPDRRVADAGRQPPTITLRNQAGPTYAGSMNTVHLTDEELEIARHGMTAYLSSFGHDEADTVALIRAVLARLAAAQQEPDPSAAVG